MEVKLSALEADLLVRVITEGGPFNQLSALYLTPAEKAGCKRLVKKGLMENIMDTFYKVTEAGRERSTSIY